MQHIIIKNTAIPKTIYFSVDKHNFTDQAMKHLLITSLLSTKINAWHDIKCATSEE